MLAHTLLSGFGSDERLTRLLNTTTFYIAPRLNPDGAELALAEKPRYIRSGVRPYPYLDKDEGLHEEDIDGDGRILQMRLPDPNGDWKISSLDPRLMEKRKPYEQGGEYYRVLTEGRIEGYDGALIKLARDYQGLDFNRNFPFEWLPEGDAVRRRTLPGVRAGNQGGGGFRHFAPQHQYRHHLPHLQPGNPAPLFHPPRR